MTRTKVVNIKAFDFDENNPDHVYIGRANSRQGLSESKWHNPFKVGDDGTREQVIRAYREWIKHQPELLTSIEELRGKTLVCWCCPEACHGDVLLELLEGSSELKIHPAAELFPPMTEAEFLGLKEDIREHGQRESIVVWKGDLVDGRHRLRACRELGIQPEIAELMDETDPWQYVVSHNLHRRHLTTAQRAMVADKLASRKQGEKKADSGIPLFQPTQAEAAKLVNVSVDSVKQARKIREKAKPEVIAAVERGEKSLNEAVAETVKPEAKKPVATKPKKSQPVAPIESQSAFDLDEATTRITNAMERQLDNWPNIQWGSKAYRFLCTNVRICISCHTVYPSTDADELSSLANSIDEIGSQIREMMGNISESDRAIVWREIVDSLSAQDPKYWTRKSTESSQ